jgi:hypothetical protein
MVGTSPTMAALSPAESEAGLAEVSIRESSLEPLDIERIDLKSPHSHHHLLTKISRECY